MTVSFRELAGDGLHISVSQIKTYLRCPRQYELRYVRGERPEFIPVALAFGIAFHAALARFYLALKETGEELTVEELIQTFRLEWEAKKNGRIPLQADEDDEPKFDPVEKGEQMLAAFHEHASKNAVDVLAVEQPFAIPLINPDTGVAEEERLVGVMDLVVEENGQPVVVEHKSSARRFSEDQLRFDPQPTAYRLAMKEQGWDEAGLRYQIVTKAKVPQVQVSDVTRTAADENDFRRVALGVLRAVDARAFYPLRGWQCRGCQFRTACAEASEAVAPAVSLPVDPAADANRYAA